MLWSLWFTVSCSGAGVQVCGQHAREWSGWARAAAQTGRGAVRPLPRQRPRGEEAHQLDPHLHHADHEPRRLGNSQRPGEVQLCLTRETLQRAEQSATWWLALALGNKCPPIVQILLAKTKVAPDDDDAWMDHIWIRHCALNRTDGSHLAATTRQVMKVMISPPMQPCRWTPFQFGDLFVKNNSWPSIEPLVSTRTTRIDDVEWRNLSRRLVWDAGTVLIAYRRKVSWQSRLEWEAEGVWSDHPPFCVCWFISAAGSQQQRGSSERVCWLPIVGVTTKRQIIVRVLKLTPHYLKQFQNWWPLG